MQEIKNWLDSYGANKSKLRFNYISVNGKKVTFVTTNIMNTSYTVECSTHEEAVSLKKEYKHLEE